MIHQTVTRETYRCSCGAEYTVDMLNTQDDNYRDDRGYLKMRPLTADGCPVCRRPRWSANCTGIARI